MRSAKGRAASAAACARRSLEAATICMGLVIFCVALVAAMRTRMSLRLAIPSLSYPLILTLGEALGVIVDNGLQLLLGIGREVAGLADVFEDVVVLAAQQREQTAL